MSNFEESLNPLAKPSLIENAVPLEKPLVQLLGNHSVPLEEVQPKGYVYLRDNAWYREEKVIKMGIAKDVRLRNSSYITCEVIRGEYICIIEVLLCKMKEIDCKLKKYFKSYNIYKCGGTEFYDRKIINLINSFFDIHNINYKVLTPEQLYILNSRNEKIDIQLNDINRNRNLIYAKISNFKTKLLKNNTEMSNAFRVIYSNSISDNWICFQHIFNTFKCNYMCAYQLTNNTVVGYIRFANAIDIDTLRNTFNLLNVIDVFIEKEINNDIYYKCLLESYTNTIEYGKPNDLSEINCNEKEKYLIEQVKELQYLVQQQNNKIALINKKVSKIEH